MKAVIFCEGQTEEVVVARLIELFYNFNASAYYILRLQLSAAPGSRPPREHGSRDAADQYFVYVCPGDGGVLPEVKKQSHTLFTAGFTRVLGLKDMLTQQYLKITNVIDPVVAGRFRENHQTEIDKLPEARNIFFHFSIMEIEAWLLSVPVLLERADPRLTLSFIQAAAGIDLSACSPEFDIFAPASTLKGIMNAIDRRYKKGNGSELFTKNLMQSDVDELLASDKCPSFNQFYLDLFDLS